MINLLNKYKLYFFFLILISALAYWVFNSSGFYFIDDSCHFNYSRHVLASYEQSIGSWHRLGRVWLFAVPAQFGLKGIQIFSALIFLFTIFFSYKILNMKNVRYAEWVVPVIGFQPVLFNISYTALAELPAACLIILSFYFYLKDKYIPVMIFSSSIFLFRTEYYFVSGLFLLIYLFRKKWFAIPLFAIGPVLWFIISWIISGEYWRFYYDMMLHARLPKITEGIDWYYYLKYSPVIFGIVQTIFFIIGVFLVFIRKRIQDFGLILIIIFGGFIIHTVLALKGLNLTCSIGQLRYLGVVGPMFGIIAVFGLSKSLEIFENKYLTGFIQIFFMFVMFILGPYATPFHTKLQIEKTSDLIAEISRTQYSDYKVLSNLHYIANSMDKAASGEGNFFTLTQSNLKRFDKELIVWDKELESSPFVDENVHLKDIEVIPNIKLLLTKIDTIDHDFDIPLHKFYKYDNELNREAYEYLTNDQYCWENYEIRVYVKN